MVSGRLSGWGTARSTSYRRLDGSGCDRECAPRSTLTVSLGLELGRGVHVSSTSPPLPHHIPCSVSPTPTPSPPPLTHPPGSALRSAPTA